jgi:hypothetical protein
VITEQIADLLELSRWRSEMLNDVGIWEFTGLFIIIAVPVFYLFGMYCYVTLNIVNNGLKAYIENKTQNRQGAKPNNDSVVISPAPTGGATNEEQARQYQKYGSENKEHASDECEDLERFLRHYYFYLDGPLGVFNERIQRKLTRLKVC